MSDLTQTDGALGASVLVMHNARPDAGGTD